MSLLRAYNLKNVANVYILLWFLYYMQGTFYASGGIIGVSIMSLFLMVSLYFFFKVNRYRGVPTYLKGLNFLVILFTIYGIIRIVNPEVIYRAGGIFQNPTTYLKSYYISVLPVYALYYFVVTGKISADWLRKWAFVFIAFAVFQYYKTEVSILERLNEKGIEVELVTNNMGYYFVSLMCLIPFFDKKKGIQYIILAICGFFVISSAKRGALLCFAVSVFIFLWYNLRHASFKKKFGILLFGVCCFLGAYTYMNYMLSTNVSFANRFIIEVGNSSGRENLYAGVINHIFNETSIWRLIFGNGADGSIAILGNYTHNDWLEFAIDMGLLGVIAYVYYYINFIRTIKDSRNFSIKMALLFLFIPCVMKSVYSMAIGDFQIYESAVLAYCLVVLHVPRKDKSLTNNYEYKL